MILEAATEFAVIAVTSLAQFCTQPCGLSIADRSCAKLFSSTCMHAKEEDIQSFHNSIESVQVKSFSVTQSNISPFTKPPSLNGASNSNATARQGVL